MEIKQPQQSTYVLEIISSGEFKFYYIRKVSFISESKKTKTVKSKKNIGNLSLNNIFLRSYIGSYLGTYILNK